MVVRQAGASSSDTGESVSETGLAQPRPCQAALLVPACLYSVDSDRALGRDQSTCSQKVTGPSLHRLTCMSAPKTPLATVPSCSRRAAARKCSYSDSARCGAPALEKLGRRPLRVSAASVNWDTTINPPPMLRRLDRKSVG